MNFLELIIILLFSNLTMAQLNDEQAVTYLNVREATFVEKEFNEGHDFTDGLAAVKEGDFWGYIDRRGEWVIEPKYDAARSFIDGCATVRKGVSWMLIDKKGENVLTNQFLELTPFEWNNATLYIASKKGNRKSPVLTGVIDAKDNELVPFEYLYLAPYQKNSQIIAFKAKNKIPYDYEETLQLSKQEGKEFFAKYMSMEVLNANFEKVATFKTFDDEYDEIRKNSNWVDSYGNFTEDYHQKKVVSPIKYPYLEPTLDSLNRLIFEKEEKKGIQFDAIHSLAPAFTVINASVQFVKVEDPSMVEFIKEEFGARKIEDELLDQHYFIFYYEVENLDQSAVYSLTGKPIIKLGEYTISAQETGFELTHYSRDGNEKGFYDFKGNVIIKPSSEYSTISGIENNRILISKYDQEDYNKSSIALFDLEGNQLTTFGKYFSMNHIVDLDNSLLNDYLTVLVYQGDKLMYGVIDKNGNEIIPPIYEFIYEWSGADVFVLQKTLEKDIYKFYYVESGNASKPIILENMIGVISSPKEGMLKIVKSKN